MADVTPPLLTDDMVSETTAALVRLLVSRDNAGRQKYGVTLDRDDLGSIDWLQHMTEELLDAAGYAQALKRALQDDPMDKLDRIVKTLELLQQKTEYNSNAISALAANQAASQNATIGYATDSFKDAVSKLAEDIGVPVEQLQEPMKNALQQLKFVRS